LRDFIFLLQTDDDNDYRIGAFTEEEEEARAKDEKYFNL
jgi:hypothetical protein